MIKVCRHKFQTFVPKLVHFTTNLLILGTMNNIQRDLDVPSSSVPKKYDGNSNMAEFRSSSPTSLQAVLDRGYIYLIHTVMLLY